MRILVFDAGPVDAAISSMTSALSLRHEVESFPYNQRAMPLRGRPSKWRPLKRMASLAVTGATSLAGAPRTAFADRALLKHIAGKHYDLVLVLRIPMMPPEIVAALKATGAVVVGWYMDAIVNVKDARFVHAPYDRVFFKDKVTVDRFRGGLADARYDFLPDGFNPENHRPVSVSDTERAAAPDVVTYGNGYPFRAKLMAELVADPALRVVIHGVPQRGTDDALRSLYAPPIFGRAKSKAVRAAKVALNTNHFGEIGGINKRTFEMAGAGAFELTDGPTIGEYFEPGREIATFAGPAELLERVRWYVDRPEERARIAEAGMARAWREHTYHHRLNALFASIPALASERPLPVPAGAPGPDDVVTYVEP
ncbi:MAG: glycosyltransferase [Polyangiales bacterium]|nr:glycosyltransferase [Myxococcales bacterium]